MDTAAYDQFILSPDLFNNPTNKKMSIAAGQSGLTEGNATDVCLLDASCWSLA
jgi:hypothetical protein